MSVGKPHQESSSSLGNLLEGLEEEDLRRELEDEDVEGAMDVVEEEHEGQKMSVDVEEMSQTSTGSRKARSRPSTSEEFVADADAGDVPEKAKRRRTSLDVTDSPVPGPSTFRGATGTGSAKGEGYQMFQNEDQEDDSSDSGTDMEPGNREGLFEEERAFRQGQIQSQGVASPPTAASGFPATARTQFRSRGLEELFRLPVYDRELQQQQGQNQNVEGPGQINDYSWRQRHRPENEVPPPAEAPLQKSETDAQNEKMLWARKLLLLTTDKIFPGFENASTDKTDRSHFVSCRVRSSWVLQAILYAEALFFMMWIFAFISTVDISISVLKELHGNMILCLSALFILVNVPRLLIGLKGNERDKLELLSLFWMTTFIVQTPLFGFILFTDIFTPLRLAFTIAMDSCLFFFLLLEFIVSTLHLKNLIRDELRIIKLAKLTEPLREQQREDPPVVFNEQDLHPLPQRQNALEEDENEWSTDNEEDDVQYQIGIRHLEEDEEQSDEEDEGSNIVTSTSDTIRQRPLRVR